MDKNEQIFELITKLNANMSEMKSEMNFNMSEMKSEIKEMKSNIKDIQTTLENVTNKNIKIIAEGHRDLSNKLDNALKIENEKELLLIRLTVLENEVARIKTRLEEIA